MNGISRFDNRVLRKRIFTISWIVTATVFAISGTAKLISPTGTMPLAIAALGDLIAYSVWLRGLGIAELFLVFLIVWRRTRVRGLVVAAAVLAGFSLFVSWNAADLSFVGNCGCFGGLEISSRYYLWLVLRNAGTVLLAVFGQALASETSSLNRSLRNSTTLAILALLLPMTIGEMRLRAHSYRAVDALGEARRFEGYQGLVMPEFEVVDQGGQRVSTSTAFIPGDYLVFVSQSCPHCRALGPDLSRLSDTLGIRHRRLVIVMLDSAAVPPDWPGAIGCAGVPVYAVRDRTTVMRLGITDVPRFVVLGADGEIEFNEAYPLAPSFWKSLNLVDRRVDGMADEVWERIVVRIFGLGARQIHPLEIVNGVGTTTVAIGDSIDGILAVVHEGLGSGDSIEMAIGLGPDGRIVDVVPLSAGAYIRVFRPEIVFVDSLRGRTLAEADSLASRALERSRLEMPVWRSLRLGLRRLSNASVVGGY